MILKEALRRGIALLKSKDIETPAVEAGVILCFAIKKDKTFLYVHPHYVLTEGEEDLFLDLVKKRAEGTPVQYLTGCQEFMSLNFIVNPHVLIPRQDTEVLVEAIISHAQLCGEENISILDIGTGSGCIAVSLAHYIKNSSVTAVDISPGALDTARANAAAHGVEEKIQFIKSNLFDGIKEGRLFDVIVSNPPYIPTEEINELQVEVRGFEPVTALDGGADGLEFYRAIAKEAVRYLKPDGLLAFEVGYNQAGDVAKLLEKQYYDITRIKDLAKIERVVTGKYANRSKV